jgi:hypothetical protein
MLYNLKVFKMSFLTFANALTSKGMYNAGGILPDPQLHFGAA